jgi:hypothetical protein
VLLQNPAVRPALMQVSVCWTLLYVVTALIEDYF